MSRTDDGHKSRYTDPVPSNLTDVFKTPGKMRGKTPRTARKRNVEENRVVSGAGVTVMKLNVVKLISLP